MLCEELLQQGAPDVQIVDEYGWLVRSPGSPPGALNEHVDVGLGLLFGEDTERDLIDANLDLLSLSDLLTVDEHTAAAFRQGAGDRRIQPALQVGAALAPVVVFVEHVV